MKTLCNLFLLVCALSTGVGVIYAETQPQMQVSDQEAKEKEDKLRRCTGLAQSIRAQQPTDEQLADLKKYCVSVRYDQNHGKIREHLPAQEKTEALVKDAFGKTLEPGELDPMCQGPRPYGNAGMDYDDQCPEQPKNEEPSIFRNTHA